MAGCQGPVGSYCQTLTTRVGQAGAAGCRRIGAGGFRQSPFERYQRSDRALIAALAEMRSALAVGELGGQHLTAAAQVDA